MVEDDSGTGVAREMPRYQCHKKVWALKIKAVQSLDGYRIIPEEPGYGPIPVNAEYMDKHRPKAGGYYVVYADGYKSFSPAEAFESGYTRVESAPSKVMGVGRMADNDRAVLVMLKQQPTDDELRGLHQFLRGWQ